jgi:hypothetical protein
MQTARHSRVPTFFGVTGDILQESCEVEGFQHGVQTSYYGEPGVLVDDNALWDQALQVLRDSAAWRDPDTRLVHELRA